MILIFRATVTRKLWMALDHMLRHTRFSEMYLRRNRQQSHAAATLWQTRPRICEFYEDEP